MRKIFIILFGILVLAPFSAHAESAYDRVMRTGVIRCAYFVVPPEFNKDPNTGKLSGIGYEVTEAVAHLLSLHVDWVEEVGFGEQAAGLSANRYDAVCSSVFNRASLSRVADFTIPFMYTPVGAFIRLGDSRFNKGVVSINDPSMTIATIDGAADEIADVDFPNARKFSMPQSSSIAMLLDSVATKKADVTFTYLANFYRYDKMNPGKLSVLKTDRPLRAYGNTLMIGRGESEFRDMLNTALNELLNSGAVDAIIAKYEAVPGSYYRVNSPYRQP